MKRIIVAVLMVAVLTTPVFARSNFYETTDEYSRRQEQQYYNKSGWQKPAEDSYKGTSGRY